MKLFNVDMRRYARAEVLLKKASDLGHAHYIPEIHEPRNLGHPEMESEQTSRIPDMQPRDILAPIATLIGLLATALGLLVGARLPTDLFRALSGLIVIVVLAFVVSAVLTTWASWSRKTSLWNYALVSYAISWIVFGVGFIFIVLVVAYGPEVFTITIPLTKVSTEVLTPVLAVIGAALGVVAGRLAGESVRELFSKIRHLKISMSGMTLEIGKQAEEEIAEERDAKWAFIKNVIELESLLRKVANSNAIDVERLSGRQIAERLKEKGVLDGYKLETFRAIWALRNTVVHGFDVPDEIVTDALEPTIALAGFLRSLQEHS